MKIDVSEFAKPCACGHAHAISVRDIFVEAGAIRRLPSFSVMTIPLRPPDARCASFFRTAG